ncbi:MAG TPA: hypothetical protein VGL48_09140 [Acidimicrobiales bacterium]
MARHAARHSRTPLLLAGAAVVVIATVVAVVVATRHSGPPHPAAATGTTGTGTGSGSHHTSSSTTSSAPITSTTTTGLPAPGPGFVPGKVTVIGDSVVLDYQDPLKTDIPGIDVEAAVSRQWGTGETLLQQLKGSDELGAQVIVALSTNGPIATADFDAMMTILQGASRVEFVNVHVDRPWQDPNNAVLAAGAARYKNVVIADWNALADQHPEWFGADGTHLAIDGAGAAALASLVTSTLSGG